VSAPMRRHTPTRWIALGVGAAVVALCVVLALQVSADDPQNEPSPLLGKTAPEFDLPQLQGDGSVSLTSLAGRPVIVNFWNSWCLPCREELPVLKEFQSRHDQDAVLVGILRDDDTGAARAYAKAEGMDWVLLDDPKGAAALAYGTRGQPETYAISADGTVVASQLGPVSTEALETMLAAAKGGV